MFGALNLANLSLYFNEGRNTGLQGLAAGILKLWEKSEVVKIGLKKNVRNMNNETMAEELKVQPCMHLSPLRF